MCVTLLIRDNDNDLEHLEYTLNRSLMIEGKRRINLCLLGNL